MHPLLENMHIIKSKLLKLEESGYCLDLFTFPNDMQIYASSNFSMVLSVATTDQEMKHINENSPTKPYTRVSYWDLTSKDGQVYLDSFIVFSSQEEKISCIWIYLYRCVFTDTQFESLIENIYNRCAEDATLYILCIDGQLAEQYTRSRMIYVDKFNNMLMQYHKQPINTISLETVRKICANNGFIEKNSINGEEILRISNINCLPYDLWTAQTFYLLQFKSKYHFQRHST